MLMTWKGRELSTVGDLSDVVLRITAEDDGLAAHEFMTEYRRVNTHADQNVGYLSGYYDPHTTKKVQRLFGVAHPVFGKAR